MYLDLTVEIPDLKTGISKKKIKGTTYIYYEYGGSITLINSIQYRSVLPSGNCVKMTLP